jgi:hypothetical protein
VTETRDDSVTWLTQEAYDRLKAELDHLSGPGRVDIAKKIEAARDEGDLRENGGYHAAKDEQGQIEARIILLQHILENARVGGPPRTDGVVGPGMTVTIRFVKDDVPARLPRGERVADRRLLAQVTAGRRHHGQEGQREGHLLAAERPRQHRRDPRRGSLRGRLKTRT